LSQKPLVKDAKTLTLAGSFAVLNAAIAEAERIRQPMCISVVDTDGRLLAFGRTDGSKALSVISDTQQGDNCSTVQRTHGGRPR
jgi:glc operon protein GlcG